MKPGISVIERAFELAATSRFDNVSQITRRLDSEGYNTLQISGPALSKQLMKEICYARSPATITARRRG